MKKKKIIKPVPQNIMVKKVKSDLKLSYYLLLLGYVLVPVLTPNFYTFDSKGPKFLALAILNLISFVVFLSDHDYTKRAEIRTGFFKSFIGIIYTLFMAISLLSFFNAINLNESILNFGILFTVFASTYILFVIFRSNRNYLLHAAMALNLLLLFDCLTVFYSMLQFMGGQVETIYDIKSVYSHKNILASAVFVKLPASIWLILYSVGWKKWLGYFVCLSAVMATIMLSTRAFYLGLVLLIIALVSFAIIRFFGARKRSQLRVIVRWAGLFLLVLLIFVTAQRLLSPKTDTIAGNLGIVSRLSSIRADESSTNARLGSWKRSLTLLLEHPVLGVGTGNWKVQVLKYETPTLTDYVYMCKNHNDFLEIFAETGIFGGLAYLSIFVLILFGFVKASLKSGSDDQLKFLFFSAFGILAYSVDAFFNFPADRPEIQTLFAIYVASAAAFAATGSINSFPVIDRFPVFQKMIRSLPGKSIAAFFILLLTGIIWILVMFVQSLHYQRYAIEDTHNGIYKHSSAFMMEGFPSIPDLHITGEPIAVNKARYLINEKRYQDAINILFPDHSSPYDSRREYFLALAYFYLGMEDSALAYSYKVLEMKPLLFINVGKICNVLQERGDSQTPVKLVQDYLHQDKINNEAWLYMINLYEKSGKLDKSIEIMDSALKYLPADTLLLKNNIYLRDQVRVSPFKDILEEATAFYNQKNYSKALTGYTKIIKMDTTYFSSYEKRGMSYFYLKEYSKSIEDFDFLIKHKPGVGWYYNIRGSCYHYLLKDEAACSDFRVAMNQGDADGTANYRKFCEKK
jgi:putative inorganic carbon (hco3(-)) transporter